MTQAAAPQAEAAQAVAPQPQASPQAVPRASIDETVAEVVEYCNAHNINNPVEILRCLQKEVIMGRALDVETVSESIAGEVNFIMVNRQDVLGTAFDELAFIKNFCLTLEVQFYGEQAEDYGGPRKEFFRLALSAIKEKYFDHGLKERLSEDYYMYMAGIIMGMSVLQNGKIPQFLDEDMLSKIFQQTSDASPSVNSLCRGFEEIGIYQICHAMPIFMHLFRPSPASALTFKNLQALLKPDFSEPLSNKRRMEDEVFTWFCKYLREAASGRRGDVTLGHVLQFATGADEEPILGFKLHPTLLFTEVETSFIPTASTCSNTLKLPHASYSVPLPESDKLFELYDYAFLNAYFGNA